MTDVGVGLIALLALFILVLAGIPIAFALAATSLAAMLLITGSVDLAALLAADASLGGVRNYVFVVVALFVLMGAFMSNSSAAGYLYGVAHLLTSRLVGGLATATVSASAVFAAVTGVSVASAAVFSRVAVPEMLRQGYDVRLALGSVAGSSVLGMLIPPSLLMILYGVLAQVSIGSLFLAGIVPGVLLAVLYIAVITALGLWRPQLVGRSVVAENGRLSGANACAAVGVGVSSNVESDAAPANPPTVSDRDTDRPPKPSIEGATDPPVNALRLLVSSGPIMVLVVGVIGGIWLGWFTPTEASAVGALGALLVAAVYGMRRAGTLLSYKEAAASVGGIMLLLIAAQMYSRMLARSGLVNAITDAIGEARLGATALVVLFVALLLLLGAVLDSSSILLIMVPLMVPAVTLLGQDPIWFGIVMIVAIEVGLLTPPFGMVAFSMKAVLGDRVRIEDIFVGSIPFIGAMLALIGLLIAFPGLALWLPSR